MESSILVARSANFFFKLMTSIEKLSSLEEIKIHTETLEQLAQVAQNSLSYNQFYYQRDVHGEKKARKTS